MDKLMKLMAKKKDEGTIDPAHKQAKMAMLQALHKEMSDMMSGDLKNPALRKVTVASDDPEGLEMGLDKAKDMLGKSPEGTMSGDGLTDDSGSEDDSDEDKAEDDQESADTGDGSSSGDDSDDQEGSIAKEINEDDLSDDDIDQLEQLLQEIKAKKLMTK